MIKVIKEGIQKSLSLNDIKDAKLNESKKYTDEEKKDIFKRWSEYSKKKYGYKQEYNYKGYTDDTYAKWDKILSKNESKDLFSYSKEELIKYLSSLDDGAEVDDPYDHNAKYHKVSNGVISGWSHRVNGKRDNVTLFKDADVARLISKDSHRSNNYTEDYEDDLPFDSADYPEELIDQDEKDELEFQKTHDGMTRSEYNQAYDGPYGYVKD